MSANSAFDGLEGVTIPPAGEDYQAGTPAYDHGYVIALIEAFNEVSPFTLARKQRGTEYGEGRDEEAYRRLLSLLDQVPQKAGEDAAAFLDGVILQGEHRLEELHAEFSYPFFSEIVGRLYKAGHNDFLLDFSGAQAVASQIGAYWLRGTEESPLRITVLLPRGARSGGEDLANCVLTVLGDAFTGGISSVSSEFIFHDRVKNFGQRSENCIFRLKGTEFVSLEDDSEMGAWAEVFFYKIRLTRGGEKEEVRVLNDFFDKGNRLYVGDDSGWREVRP